MTNFLGIHVGHNASASLMVDGKIIFAVQEERFNKIKNFMGYPSESIKEIMKYVAKKKMLIDEAAFATKNQPIFPLKYPVNHFFSIEEFHKYYGESFYSKKIKGLSISNYIKNLKKDKRFKKNIFNNIVSEYDLFENVELCRKIQVSELKKTYGKYIKNINFLDHHTCHAYYAKFAIDKNKKEKSCVVILDSEGDGNNQTLWSYNPKLNPNTLENLLTNGKCDLARIYKMITLILNMKPDEHEFKVMGMAPYGKKKYYLKIYKEILKPIMKFDGLKIVPNNRPKDLFLFLRNSLRYERFDNIAAASQYYLEKMVKDLCFKINKKYKIRNFYFGGGISMNIKMYKDLAKYKFIKKIINSPSGSDESLSIGACFYLNRKNQSEILKNIYLGKQLIDDDKDLLSVIKKKFNSKKFQISKVKTDKIGYLLHKNQIIAIADGREEFGARALGARSIIANPSSFSNVQKINEFIKSRDFWMPFALSILKKHQHNFIENPKKLESKFMNLSFDTKFINHNKIKAGCHPYDKTVRPQFIDKNINKNFYEIIDSFYKITKIPALLNTSLNLHGNPKCSDLYDVINTFIGSDLRYLYLQNKFLIKKLN